MDYIVVDSEKRCQMIDITSQVRKMIEEKGWKNGILVLNSMHTTGGLTVNESYDPDVQQDLMRALEKMVPDIKFDHMEGNSDSHLKTSLVGTDLNLIVDEGDLLLGRWQGIYFCEFDGPRRGRRVACKFIGESF